MSETQIKKLNLRALKHDDVSEKSIDTPSEQAQVDENTATMSMESSVDTPSTENKEKSDEVVPTVPKISLKMLQKDDSSQEKQEPEEKKEEVSSLATESNETVKESSKNQEPIVAQEADEKPEEMAKKLDLHALTKANTENVIQEEEKTSEEQIMKTEKEEGSSEEEKSQKIVPPEEPKKTKKISLLFGKKKKTEEEKVPENAQKIEENEGESNEPKDAAQDFLDKLDKEEQEENKKLEKTEKKESENEKVVFQNYESKFKKQSTNVLKRIQNFRYAPKTRVGMLAGLVTFTIVIISSLMFFLPDKHSVNIYKASILDIYNGSEVVEPTNTIPENNTTPEIPTDIPEETPEIPQEDSSPEETPSVSENEIIKREKQKERIRQHILDKYKS